MRGMRPFDRRDSLRGAAVALAATQLGLPRFAHAQSLYAPTPNRAESSGSEPNDTKGILVSAAATGLPAPEGPGAVSGAPNLPDGFADTFASQYVAAGAVRLHAVTGGDGMVLGRPELPADERAHPGDSRRPGAATQPRWGRAHKR